MTFPLTFGLAADSGWLAQAGLTVILLLMFITGVILLLLACRDLIRDLGHYLGDRSSKNGDDHSSRAA
jgi:hypothetical protein